MCAALCRCPLKPNYVRGTYIFYILDRFLIDADTLRIRDCNKTTDVRTANRVAQVSYTFRSPPPLPLASRALLLCLLPSLISFFLFVVILCSRGYCIKLSLAIPTSVVRQSLGNRPMRHSTPACPFSLFSFSFNNLFVRSARY
jgi:hypothetical protein